MGSLGSSSLGDTITFSALAVDPFPLIAALRTRQPVAWAPAMGRWLISRHDLILAVLSDVDRFTTNHPRSPIRATFGPQMLSTDGVEQRRHRGSFTPAFRPGALRSGVADAVRSRATRLAAAIKPGDDLTEPASAMAVGTVLDVLGISEVATPDTVAAWYTDLAGALANVSGEPDVAAREQRAATAFRAAIMHLGKIVEVASNDELFSHPCHPYTRVLLESLPSARPSHERERMSPEELEGETPDPHDPPPGCRFHTRCPIGPRARPDRSICVEHDLHQVASSSPHNAACHFPLEQRVLDRPDVDGW